MRGLNGMRVVVTGAAGGIGTAIVDRLVSEGARVAGFDMGLPEHPGLALGRAVDVTEESAVSRAVAEVAELLGGVDAVVAGAGIQASAPTHELDVATFRKVLDVSVIGTFLVAKAALPGMLERGDGRIVTFGSTAAVCAAPALASYAAAKGAVLQFTRSIAVEYARRGIRANCLCPGGTMTPMMAQIDAEREGPDHFREAHPIGRYARPDEIASAAAYLLSDDSSYMLGAAVMVDGGFSAR